MNTTTNTTLTVFYNDEYVNPNDAETRTKARPIARMITEGEVPGVTLKSPQSVTREQLLQIHDARYLDELWSKDPKFLASILASTGGVLAALDQAMIDGASGTLSSGLHHAQRGAENGLCYLNGLALVVHVAIERYVLTDVGILDTDAHWGGGTFQLVGNNPKVRISDVTVSDFDRWQSSESRHHLKMVSDPKTYLDEVKQALMHLEGIELLVYNAGMDPFEDCGTGGKRGITREILEERERLVAQWCIDTKTPALFTLAGGYMGHNLDLEGVARLHLPTIREFQRIIVS
jgi:acetoin utilization deacetylase AcuC-like enzyme